MKDELEKKIAEAIKALYDTEAKVELTRPEERFGDYATNVALQLSKELGKNPREIAESLADKLREPLNAEIGDISIAGPGFLNLKLSDKALLEAINNKPAKALENQIVVTEYSDPNPFKVLHAGHLYTSIVGDAISNLLEQAGARVHRVNFGGDVGLHVAKCIWAIIQQFDGEKPEKLSEIPASQRADWLGARYVEGHIAYVDEIPSQQIIDLNKRIYKLHADGDHNSPLGQIYWTAREWSYQYFKEFYNRIGISFEKYYPESETAQVGLDVVREQQAKGVYKESEGAIVFDGEPHGLHARVFINSEGLPTYEAKDVGLIIKKYDDYKFDKSVVITANDIAEYMKVVLKSIEQFRPELSQATTHLTHGMVRLAGGVKMSSRLGNILRAVDVLDAAAEANKKQIGQHNDDTVLGAVKYAFVKQRMGGDIIYDPDESVSLEGNSGPYLQYAHARARSILAKASNSSGEIHDFDAGERALARKISEYPEVVNKTVTELMPHHIATYLYELAQTFNRFYENNRVVGNDRESARITLVNKYAETLKNGLGLLGINAPDKM